MRVKSVHKMLSLLLLPPTMLFPCTSVGSFPQETALHKTFQHGPFPWVKSFRTDCSYVCFPQGHRSWQGLAPVQALYRLPTPSGCTNLLHCGVLQGLQVNICSTLNLYGLHGDSLPHHGLHMGCRAISAAAPGVSLLTPFSVTLVPARYFSPILTPFILCDSFYTFLNASPMSCHQCQWRTQLWTVAGLPIL